MTSLSMIGIDIGGTGIKGGVTDLTTGRLEGDRVHIATPNQRTPQAVADAVAEVVRELEQRMEAQSVGAPVGVTYPGIVQHGVARSAANLDPSWVGFDIQALFTDRLHRSVEIINDADAVGLAEVKFGAGKGVSGIVLAITLGTGIGSAFVFDGKLVPNSELGHLEIDGFVAETKASAVARERNNMKWEQYSVVLQRYFSHVEFLFSPDLFIVGGGISACADEYLPRLKLNAPIAPATLRNDAGIIGAALQAAALHPDAIAEKLQISPSP